MAKGLAGKRIVIAGSRKIHELSEIIERQGGITLVRSQQGTTVLQETEVEHDLNVLLESGTDWVVFTTGTGLEAILKQAERLDVQDKLLEILGKSQVGARGYKTYTMLKQLGIKPMVMDDDGTTEGLIRELQAYDFTRLGVTIQLHGEQMPSLVNFFELKGAVVRTILPYKHVAPDFNISQQLYREIIEGSVDAVCFTTAVQVRYFYEYVKTYGDYQKINACFQEQVLAVAVGRVTAKALKEEGVSRVLMPETERMGAMIVELSHYYQMLRSGEGITQ